MRLPNTIVAAQQARTVARFSLERLLVSILQLIVDLSRFRARIRGWLLLFAK